jgi:RNA polymerase sigma-32 factor
MAGPLLIYLHATPAVIRNRHRTVSIYETSRFKPQDKFMVPDKDSRCVRNGRSKLLSRNDERELIRRWQMDGDHGALSRLCRAFSPLVLSIARQHAGGGGPLEDLIQEGNIGLLEAIQRFDPERGFRLSTYSRWWIEAVIRNFKLRSHSIVRAPKRRAGPQIYLTDVSTSERPGDDGLELSETLVDDRPSPEAEVMERMDREIRIRHVRAALAELTDRESYVISRRYLGDRPETLSVLGEKLGISKERVRQIEVNGCDKLERAVSRRMSNEMELNPAA